MKTTLYTILLAMTAMLVACDADYTTEAKSQLVVEGWIDEGGYPVVILTKSLTISDKYQQADSLSQYLIRWANVFSIFTKYIVIPTVTRKRPICMRF